MNVEMFRLEVTHVANIILEPLGYSLWVRYDSMTDKFKGYKLRRLQK